MSVFAIVPWAKQFENDMMFEINSSINRDNLLEPYLEMKKEFEKKGHTIHTIDLYENYDNIDFFLFFSLDWSIYDKIVQSGNSHKMVYCTAEPPSVFWYNSRKGYYILKHIFPYILSWNDDWIDNKSVFKRNIPYFFVDQRNGNLPYKEKNLLTTISGNKSSNYKGELYSERKKAIVFFEDNHPEDFRFYGVGWDREEHSCYVGKAENKAHVYHKYKFALCYENIEGLNGYVTEKILDCLMSGIVPIYAGAADIEKYIPNNCFIKLRDFDSYEKLYSFISKMEENSYNEYLRNADDYLKSAKPSYFSGAKYAHYIMDAVSNDKSDFKSSIIALKILMHINFIYNKVV